MVEPFMSTKHVKCPHCGQVGMWAELKDKQGKTTHVAEHGNFRVETHDDAETLICGQCERAIPMRYAP